MKQLHKRHPMLGFSLIELLIVGVIIVAIIWILRPTCIVWKSAIEVAVQEDLRTINTAEAKYLSHFGKFATTLAQLGPPAATVPGPPVPDSADLISSSLAAGERDGYRFFIAVTPAGYKLTATPKVRSNIANRSYYTDQSMVLRWSAERADASSPEVK